MNLNAIFRAWRTIPNIELTKGFLLALLTALLLKPTLDPFASFGLTAVILFLIKFFTLNRAPRPFCSSDRIQLIDRVRITSPIHDAPDLSVVTRKDENFARELVDAFRAAGWNANLVPDFWCDDYKIGVRVFGTNAATTAIVREALIDVLRLPLKSDGACNIADTVITLGE